MQDLDSVYRRGWPYHIKLDGLVVNAPTRLAGRRVLVVEDEALIALTIEELLQGLGCSVIGPVGRLDRALQLAEEPIDAAILDVTIRGGLVFPVAERLLERGVPFILASGYGEWALPPEFRDRERLVKPFSPSQLEESLRRILGSPT